MRVEDLTPSEPPSSGGDYDRSTLDAVIADLRDCEGVVCSAITRGLQEQMEALRADLDYFDRLIIFQPGANVVALIQQLEALDAKIRAALLERLAGLLSWWCQAGLISQAECIALPGHLRPGLPPDIAARFGPGAFMPPPPPGAAPAPPAVPPVAGALPVPPAVSPTPPPPAAPPSPGAPPPPAPPPPPAGAHFPSGATPPVVGPTLPVSSSAPPPAQMPFPGPLTAPGAVSPPPPGQQPRQPTGPSAAIVASAGQVDPFGLGWTWPQEPPIPSSSWGDWCSKVKQCLPFPQCQCQPTTVKVVLEAPDWPQQMFLSSDPAALVWAIRSLLYVSPPVETTAEPQSAPAVPGEGPGEPVAFVGGGGEPPGGGGGGGGDLPATMPRLGPLPISPPAPDGMCGRLLHLRSALIDWGHELRTHQRKGAEGKALGPAHYLKVQNLIPGVPFEEVVWIEEAAYQLAGLAFLGPELERYERIVAQWVPLVDELVLDLLAVRAVLRLIASLAIQGSASSGYEESSEVAKTGVGAAGVGLRTKLLPFELGGTKTWSTAAKQSGEWQAGSAMSIGGQPALVPLLDLLDFFVSTAARVAIPSFAEVVAGYMRGGMPEEAFACWLNLLGIDEEAYAPIIRSARQQHDTHNLVQLWRRGYLTDEEFERRLEALGWKDRHERAEVAALADEMPGPSDIVRFMVRDVDDPRIVEAFGLDADFEKKYQGKTAEYGRAQGLSEELARRYWRAHWDIPSNTQLYTMVHRLRPDVPEYKNAGLATTLEDVLLALQQNDVLPFWQKRLLEIAYHPTTRVDSQRMYFLGIIDFEQLTSKYQDLGYKRQNAEELARFQRVRKWDWLAQRPESKAFVDGAMTRDDLRRRLDEYRIDDEDWRQVIWRLEIVERRAVRRRCVSAMRRRYLTGEWKREEAIIAVTDAVGDGPRAVRLVEGWECERLARGKAVPAGTLCRWFGAGIISKTELQLRLVRLGYLPLDARHIADHCEREWGERRIKELLRESEQDERRRQALEDRRKRDQERADRESERESNRVRRDAEREAKRLDRLAKAARSLAGKLDEELSAAAELIQTSILDVMDRYYWSQPEAEQLVRMAVTSFSGTTYAEWHEHLEREREAEDQFDLASAERRPRGD